MPARVGKAQRSGRAAEQGRAKALLEYGSDLTRHLCSPSIYVY